jgi:hypothetical protein
MHGHSLVCDLLQVTYLLESMTGYAVGRALRNRYTSDLPPIKLEFNRYNSEFAQQPSEPPDGCFALRKMVAGGVRFPVLVFEHSTSIASVHIIHGCQAPSIR